MKKTKKLVSAVNEADKVQSVKIAFSSVINREDDDLFIDQLFQYQT